MTTLSPKEARFAAVYVRSLNAAEAARQAGYKSARQAGHKLLQRPLVAAEIRRRQQALSKDLDLSADRVLKGLADVAFAPSPEPVTHQNRLTAFAMLGKHLGLFIDKHEISIGQRMSGVLTKIKERMSPAAQEELMCAVSAVLAAENLTPSIVEAQS